MTDNQKLEALHEMFQSTGWHVLEEQLRDQEKLLNSIDSLTDEKQLFFAKGRLFTIKECLNLPPMVRAALEAEDTDASDV